MFSLRSLPTRRSIASLRPLLGLLLPLALGACESTDDPKHPVVEGDILLAKENNYVAVMDLTITDYTFDPANTALQLDWNALAAGLNIRKEAAKPIDLVVFAKYPGTREAAEAAIEKGTVGDRASGGPQLTVTGRNPATASLSEFGDTVASFFATPSSTFMITFTNGTDATRGIQEVAFVVPTAGDTTPTLTFPDGSQQIASFTPTLGIAVDVPRLDPGSIGWGAVGVNGLGQAIEPYTLKDINRVLVAYFAGKAAPDLQNQDTFLNLESQATTLYEAAVEHAGADATSAIQLSQLKNRAGGAAFTGFIERSGVWIFAAMCDSCNNPAIVLSVLNPVGD